METLQEVKTINNKATGICITCNHQDECQQRNQISTDIWFCEEFDDYITPENIISPELIDSFNSRNITNNLGGLCANCDLGTDCIHAKKTGGVWFCEQYE